MKLKLIRTYDSGDETIGQLLLDEKLLCFTLEDEHRDKKVYSETRIPAGKFEIKYRTSGRMHERYSKNFPATHKGMLELQNVPGFSYIYIHIGNEEDDTSGCILVGAWLRNSKGRLSIVAGTSTAAYLHLYSLISEVLDTGEKVFIEIYDIDKKIKEL